MTTGLLFYGSHFSPLHRRESQKETPEPITLIIDAWNIKTMYKAGKTAQIASAMCGFNTRVLRLGKKRWLQAGQERLVTTL
jgi:hypothetical protein